METIRKKICFDRLISHRNGISPYVSKGSNDVNVKYVTDITSESNYGSFPCDFVLNSSIYYTDEETGLNTRKNTEISRLRYADVLRWYNNVNNIIRQGEFLKRIDYNYENVTFEECTDVNNPLYNCGLVTSSITESELVETSLWLVDKGNLETIFNCVAVDFLFFKKYKNGVYSYDEKNTEKYKLITENSVSPLEELPEEDRKFVEKMNYYVIGTGDVDDISTYNGLIFSLGSNDVIFAFEKFDEYKKYEGYWNEWWDANWQLCTDYSSSIRWEQKVFDINYVEPLSLKFVYDFEKYILGKVQVPEKYNGAAIEGSKVPNCVFYLNYMDYLVWFNNNIGFLDSNEDLQREWDKRGGETFKAFLESIEPVFITEPEIPENTDYVYFGYSAPNAELDFAFVDEFYNEYSYAVYEYSVGLDGEIIDATVDYECGGDDELESALTPTFVSITDSAITVESKLDTLFKRDVYYIDKETYGVFDNFHSGGQLFSCTYHMGESSSGKNIACYSGTVEYYAKTSANTWNLVKTINVKETEINVQNDEIYPKVTNGKTYQVVGIKELYEMQPVFTLSNLETTTTYSDDGTLKIVSLKQNYTKTIKKYYSWWECYEENDPNIVCGDGEDIDFSTAQKYRNILLLSCAPDYCEGVTGKYYYMVKYDNGYTVFSGIKPINSQNTPKVLKLPYTTGKTNIESYSGEFSGIVKYDKITSIDVSGDVMTINYVIGATSGADINTSGIHYVDTYSYEGNVFVDTVVDGFFNAQILCEKVVAEKKQAFSDDFNATRDYIPSVITGMEIATQWTPESSLRAYLYTDDSFDNLIEYPNIGVDITFNRGNAAAWESHFKLSECNTFEDLQNYGNNYFNL
jgi:hypothetical protein